MRSNLMRKKKLSLDVDGMIGEHAAYANFCSGATNAEKHKKMLKFIDQIIENELTPRQQDCMRFYYGENMKVEDIAELMQLRPTTVYKHISKARQAIKKRLYIFDAVQNS